MAAANETRCNRLGAKSYPAWRACWHRLLDPYSQKLRAIGDALRNLQVGAFPPACVTALKAADTTFQGFAGRVDMLSAGIDSDKRAAQTRATNSYNATIKAIENDYAKPFQSMTQACYSPEELKKLNSRKTASPSP